jgi:hypothetical protein
LINAFILISFRVGFDVSEENPGTPGLVPVLLIFAGHEIRRLADSKLHGQKGADQGPPLTTLRIVPSITVQCCIVSRTESGVVCEWIGDQSAAQYNDPGNRDRRREERPVLSRRCRKSEGFVACKRPINDRREDL